MKPPGPSLRRVLGLAGALGVCAALIWAAPRLLQALRTGAQSLNLQSLLVVCALQWVTWGVCALALRSLAPALTVSACLASRWVRDGASNLLPLAPGVGEFAGVRMLVGAGAPPALAVAATAADIASETLAQAPYTVLGLAFVPAVLTQIQAPALTIPSSAGLVAALLGAVLLCLGAKRAAPWLIRKNHALCSGVLAELSLHSFPAAVGLHLLAWTLGGLQLWAGSHLLGFGLDLRPAIALESLVYAGRALFFFIPGGVGVQEAGFLGIGAAMGVPAADALAFALLFRARDAVAGAPALIAWALCEGRLGRRNGRERLTA